MRTGDLHILAALLGVGVVLSPLARSGAPPSVLEATARSVPRERRLVHALTPAPQAAPTPIVRSAEARAPASPAAIVEGRRVGSAFLVEGTLGRFDGLADRDFGLVVDDHGAIDAHAIAGRFALDGRAVLIHVAASWCRPCVDDLASFLGLAAIAPRALIIAAEDVSGPAGLANALETLAEEAEASSRAWPHGLELRADPAWAWMRWLGHDTLPLTAVIDGAGVLRLVVSGALDEAASERVAAVLRGAP